MRARLRSLPVSDSANGWIQKCRTVDVACGRVAMHEKGASDRRRPLLYLGWYFLSLLLVVAFHDCNHAKPDHGNARDNEHYQRKAVGIARHS